MDPIALFLERRAAAVAAGALFDGTKAVLSTATKDGVPSSRYVLVKEVGEDGFFVYTNYESRKARELDENPRAAICVHWAELDEQWRIEGTAERAAAARSDAYFASRPRGSQLGAWASDQSREIDGRETLMRRLEEVTARYEGEAVPRPAHWGGYRVIPTAIERWINGEARLHDRFRYTRTDSGWTMVRLAP